MTSQPAAPSPDDAASPSQEPSKEAVDANASKHPSEDISSSKDAPDGLQQESEVQSDSPKTEDSTESPQTAESDQTPNDQRSRRRIQIGSRRGMAGKAVRSSRPLMAIPKGPDSTPTVSGEADASSLAVSSPPSGEPPDDQPAVDTPAHVSESAAAGRSVEPPAGGESSEPGPSEPAEAVAEAADAVSPKERDEERELEKTAPSGPPKVTRSVPPPSRRDPLAPELEAELNAALDGVALDQLVDDTAAAGVPLEPQSRIQATVVRVDNDSVFVTLGGRNEGVVPLRQFKEPPAIGLELEVIVKAFHEEDGLYEVLVPGAAVEVADWSDLTEGSVVEARITGANTGGLECMVGHIRGFIPASQIAVFRVEDFAQFIGEKLPCVVTEANRRRKNLVLSHRAILEREKEEQRRQFLESLAPGQVMEGVVRSIQKFGAFVDLGGVDGLIHISQLSWERVEHPKDVLEVGQKVKVKIEKVNQQTGKISLSYRDLLEHPWHDIEQRFPEGSLVKGTISRVAKFGAFVKVAPGVEGLVHISELAHHRVRRVEDVVNEGQEVEVRVLSVDADQQRMGLSLKAALPEPPPEEREEDEPRRETVPKRRTPLKGGFDHPSGGEQFGLKW